MLPNGNTSRTVHAFLGEDRDVGLGFQPAEVAAHDALAGQEVEGRQRDWPVVLLHAQDDRLALALTPRIRMMRSYLLENGGCIWRDRSMG